MDGGCKSCWALGLALVLLFGTSLLFRATSLNTGPIPSGDEYFLAIQGVRLLRGEPWTWKTPSGKLVSLPFMLTRLPVDALLPPSNVALRVPAVFAGAVAIVLMYVLVARVLDRTTALIAVGILAVLPIAIIASRVSWELCQIPAFGVLIFYFASRAHRGGLALALVASFLAHPTTVFLVPWALGAYCFRSIQLIPEDPRRGWLRMASTVSCVSAAAGLLAWLQMRTGAIRYMKLAHQYGRRDWSLFLSYFKNLLLGFCEQGPTKTSPFLAWAFWTVVLGVLLLGAVRLMRDKRWDRLILVAGLLVTVCGFHVVAGADAIRPEFARYGVFLVVPFVLASGCLLKATLVVPSTPGRTVVRRLQLGVLVAAGFAILLMFKQNYFDSFNQRWSGPPERIWTLRSEIGDHWDVILDAIEHGLGSGGTARPRPLVIITEDWWTYRPLQYHALARRGIKVASLLNMSPDAGAHVVKRQLNLGAYVVCVVNRDLDRVVKATFPWDALRDWTLSWFRVYSLRHPAGATGSSPVRATASAIAEDARLFR
jgi:hypothetical protein